MDWKETVLSILFLVLVLTDTVNCQSTIESFFSSLPTLAPSTEPENSTNVVVLNLDEILSVVNKTETTSVPLPSTVSSASTYGDRVFMHAINNNYKKEDLMGRTLRLVVPKIEPPYVNYVNFSDAEVLRRGYGPGVVIEILKMMRSKLNLTYEIVPFNEGQWGALENGNWTGAFGAMYRKEADVLVGGAIMQYDRGQITDLTFPFQYAPTAMLIRSPERYNDNTWLIVTQPFRWEVWVLTAGTILVSGAILWIFVRFLTCADEVQYTVIESVWIFFSIAVQQGLPVQPRSWACRVMLAMWWLASITLMATFTGSLVALFAVDKVYMPFNNIQQLVSLVQRGSWRIVMDGTTMTRTNMIRESESQTYKDLWYEMSVNRKVDYVKGTEAGVDYILANGNTVLLGPEDSMKYWATVDCRLKKLDEGILPTYLSIPFAKDSDYSTYASTLIRDLVERGFVDKWIKDYTNYMAVTLALNKCNRSNSAADKYLDLSKAQGAFWVLCGGFAIGITLFIIECIYKGIMMLYAYYLSQSDDGVSMRKEEMKRSSKNSNTTSSVTSNDTGGEPEISKGDDKEISRF